jgi:hypothetical protein
MPTRWTHEQALQYYLALVQPSVPEPVIAVGVLSPAGTWGNMLGSKLSPGAGSAGRARNNKRAGGLARTGGFKTPTMATIALTADRAYVFHTGFKHGQQILEEHVVTWERNDLRVTVQPGKLATTIVFDVVSTGDHYELEGNNVRDDGFTQAFIDALTADRV